MIFNLYLIYNRKVQAYERPIISQDDPNEFVEHVHRDYLASGNVERAKIEECDIIHVGTFDDNRGQIKLIEPNLLINCSVFAKPVTEQRKKNKSNA